MDKKKPLASAIVRLLSYVFLGWLAYHVFAWPEFKWGLGVWILYEFTIGSSVEEVCRGTRKKREKE